MGLQPISEMIRLTVDIDQHPPLYPILLHFWMQIAGSSEAGARSMSAALGVLTIIPIYFLAKTLSGKTVGLLSALVLAVSPFHVQYAQEARAYTLLALCAAVSMWMLARLLLDPNARVLPVGWQIKNAINNRRPAAEDQGQAWWRPIQTDLAWFGYMISTALAVYGHNTAIFLPVATNAFVLGWLAVRRLAPASSSAVSGVERFQAPSFKNWMIAQAGVLLLWSPWMAGFFIQVRGIADEFWIPRPTLETVSSTLKNFLMAFLPERINWQWLVWIAFIAALALA